MILHVKVKIVHISFNVEYEKFQPVNLQSPKPEDFMWVTSFVAINSKSTLNNDFFLRCKRYVLTAL